jgi:hypothetical protein
MSSAPAMPANQTPTAQYSFNVGAVQSAGANPPANVTFDRQAETPQPPAPSQSSSPIQPGIPRTFTRSNVSIGATGPADGFNSGGLESRARQPLLNIHDRTEILSGSKMSYKYEVGYLMEKAARLGAESKDGKPTKAQMSQLLEEGKDNYQDGRGKKFAKGLGGTLLSAGVGTVFGGGAFLKGLGEKDSIQFGTGAKLAALGAGGIGLAAAGLIAVHVVAFAALAAFALPAAVAVGGLFIVGSLAGPLSKAMAWGGGSALAAKLGTKALAGGAQNTRQDNLEAALEQAFKKGHKIQAKKEKETVGKETAKEQTPEEKMAAAQKQASEAMGTPTPLSPDTQDKTQTTYNVNPASQAHAPTNTAFGQNNNSQHSHTGNNNILEATQRIIVVVEKNKVILSIDDTKLTFAKFILAQIAPDHLNQANAVFSHLGTEILGVENAAKVEAIFNAARNGSVLKSAELTDRLTGELKIAVAHPPPKVLFLLQAQLIRMQGIQQRQKMLVANL